MFNTVVMHRVLERGVTTVSNCPASITHIYIYKVFVAMRC